MKFNIEYELEVDGRWIAEITMLPGALAYGKSQEEAAAKVISEKIELNTFPKYLEISYLTV